MPKTISELRGLFDFVYYTEITGGRTDQQELIDFSNGGNGGDLYWTLEAAQGLLSAFMGSGHRDYLDQLIISCNNWIESSAIASTIPNNNYSDSFRGWLSNSSTSITGQGLAAPGGENGLYDSRGWMAYTKMLWVLLNSPNLRAESTIIDGKTYQQHYDDILAFTEEHIWNKWETRLVDILLSSAVDRSAAFANIALWLWKCTGTQKYKDAFDEFNTGSTYGLRSHIEVNDFDSSAWQWCLLWSCNVYEGNRISDHGHASRAVKLMTDANLVDEYWTDADMVKIMNTFKVIAPLGSSDTQAYKWMNRDDSGGDDNRPKYHEGFTSAARVDETYQERLEDKTTTYERQYISAQTNMYGELIFNRAYIENDIQYPETMRSSVSTIKLVDNDIKAFPTAVGHGRNATGGRGGDVYVVTNLNGSGAGSFREGVQSGVRPRTIVFAVSGVMDDSGGDYISIGSTTGQVDGDLTIAGETSPNGFVVPQEIRIFDSNVIMRHITVMNHSAFRTSGRANLRIVSYNDETIENVIIDHCSFMGADDEIYTITASLNSNQVQNVTIQNCMSVDNIGVGYNAIQYYQTYNISWYQNLLGYTTERHIRLSSARHSAEMINNYTYNYSGQSACVFTYGVDADVIGNHWDHAGNAAPHAAIVFAALTPDHPTGQNSEAIMSNTELYYDDNLQQGTAATYDSNAQSRLQGSRVLPSDIIPYPANEVRNKVLANAGATIGTSQPENTYFAGRRSDVQNLDTGGRITSFTYPTSYPTISTGISFVNSNGLSDAYNAVNGTPVATERPATAVLKDGTILDQSNVTNYSNQGYTHLDIFLADLAGDWDGFERIGTSITPDIISKRISASQVIILNN